MLNPWIRLGWPANSSETLLMTPGVSILSMVVSTSIYNKHGTGSPAESYVWLLKSFMISRNLLYTSGCS